VRKISFRGIFTGPVFASLAVFAAVLGYFAASHLIGWFAPIEMDTARMLLLARDCAEGGGCSQGIGSSFKGLNQGSGAFVRFLAVFPLLGLSSGWMIFVVYLILSVVVSAFHFLMTGYMGAGRALSCTVLYFILVEFTGSVPVIDLQLFARPFIFLCFFGILRFNRAPNAGSLLLMAASLGAAMDTQFITAILVPVLAAFVVVRPDKGRVFLLSVFLLTVAGVMGVLSWERFMRNVVTAFSEGYAVAAAGLAALLYVFLRRKRESIISTPLFFPAAVALYVVLSVTAMSVVLHEFAFRYLMPAAGFVAMTLPFLLDAAAARAEKSLPFGSVLKKTAMPAFHGTVALLAALCLVFPVVWVKTTDIWLISDVEDTARYYYGKKGLCFSSAIEKIELVAGSTEYETFLSTLAAMAPRGNMNCDDPDPGATFILALDLREDLFSKCGVEIGAREIGVVPVGGSGHLYEKRAWLKRDEFKACLETESGVKAFRRCIETSSRDIFPLEKAASVGGGAMRFGDLAYRTNDRLLSILRDAERGAGKKAEYSLEYIFEISIPGTAERKMIVVCNDAPPGFFSEWNWRIEGIENVEHIMLQDNAAVVSGRKRGEGRVRVKAVFGENRQSWNDVPFPNVLEIPLK
jgi:hypothetical protein